MGDWPQGPSLSGLRIRSDVLQVMLACGLGLFAVEIVTYLHSIGLIDRLSRSCLAFASCSPSGEGALIDAAERDDGIRQVLVLVELAFLIVTGVAWLVWQHRGHRIVRQRWRRLGTRFSPAWGVGCWFVPLANLALPCQAHAELWRASNPDAGALDWNSGRLGWRVPVWWAVWLVSGFGGLVLSGAFAPDEASTPDQLTASFRASAVATLLQLIAAVLALLVVRGLSRRVFTADAHLVRVDEPAASLLPAVEGLPPPPSATRSPEAVAPIRGWFLAVSAAGIFVGGIAAVLIAGLELPASAF